MLLNSLCKYKPVAEEALLSEESSLMAGSSLAVKELGEDPTTKYISTQIATLLQNKRKL